MNIISDLHVHSKHSRATSKNLDLENLEKYGRIKGLNLIGTGDFTHPIWIKELKNKLIEDETGILKTKSGFNFLLQTEISNIYTQDGKQRRIHNILLAPNFETVEQIIERLSKKGRLDYDGRPIFGFNCIELVEMLKEINNNIEIIPAHIWTPWYSLFGSMSGFDSVDECFQEQSKHIHALETGLSSDPTMNWRLSKLDRYTLVSFSDSHSFWPWRIGREATVFDIKELTYKNVIKVLRERDGIKETVEVNPNFGKYHLTGHRNCEVCLRPKDSIKNNNICPKCKKQLTIGVLQRVEQLADRDVGYTSKENIRFRSMLPLAEIISAVIGQGVSTKSVLSEYFKLVKNRSEFDVLIDMRSEELSKLTSEKIASAIIKNRDGKLKVSPGYDGVYGKLLMDENDENNNQYIPEKTPIQHNLTEFV
ncbi:MAG: endonuclease Q family protein [Nanoarchaeota archaeon]